MSTTTPRRSTRQSASNTPSSSTAKIFVVSDTPTRPTKRARTSSSPKKSKYSPRKKAGRPRKEEHEEDDGDGDDDGGGGDDDDDDDDDDNDDNDDNDGDDDGSDDGLIATLAKRAPSGTGFVHRNAFDAYFAAASKPARTSNNVFSALVPPLAPGLLAQSTASQKHAPALDAVLKAHEALFPRYALELAEGFNLLFFGFGSKRRVLNTFARTVCARRGHVVVVNAYMPRVGLKELLASIEAVPGLTDVPLAGSGTDAQTRRIYEFFLPPAVRPSALTAARPLFLLIHNIDRAPRPVHTALALLALCPRIHVVASVDHVHAPMLWSTAAASARKHVYDGAGEVPLTRGFAWVWHDMTTLQPYDAELAHAHAELGGAAAGKAKGREQGMTESAAQHILASVNAKAKKLFVLLAQTLLAALEEAGEHQKQKERTLQHHAVSYEALFHAARTDFIATNDTSFKALLAEFRDHGLVLTDASAGAETLWIPLRPEELRRVVASLPEQ